MPLHPFIIDMLEQLKGRPALSAGTVAEGRALLAAPTAALGPGPEMAQVRDFDLPTRAGSIPARLMIPEGTPRGIAVHLHGGGWALGSMAEFDACGRVLAQAGGCAVLLPDYRLVPEHPFPAGLEDAEDAILWAVREGGAAVGIGGPAPVAVSGDSAGGNLAAVAARRLRGRAPLAMQALIYPVTDCDFARPSYAAHGRGLPLTADDMAWFFDLYAPGALREGPDVSPLRADDLSGLPPALVMLAEYDVLHDEGAAYADALEAAGVPVTRERAEGLTHGFIRLHNVCPPAREALERIGRAMGDACDAARARAPG